MGKLNRQYYLSFPYENGEWVRYMDDEYNYVVFASIGNLKKVAKDANFRGIMRITDTEGNEVETFENV